jgi:5-azacytidine-induced protein 1
MSTFPILAAEEEEEASVRAFMRKLDAWDSELPSSLQSGSGSAFGAGAGAGSGSLLQSQQQRRQSDAFGGRSNLDESRILPGDTSTMDIVDVPASPARSTATGATGATGVAQPPPLPQSSLSFRSGSGTAATADNIRSQVISMSLELEEKGRTIAIMRSQLARAKRLVKDVEDAGTTRLAQRLAAQKEHYESAMARQLAFADHLLSSKTELATQVETLTSQLEQVRSDAQATIEKVKEAAAGDMERAREAWAAHEKAKRTAWQEQQMKEIKAKTLKSLEPDITRLLEKHKEEVSKIQQACADQVEAARSHFELEKAAAIKAAREEVLGSDAEVLQKEKDSLRAREHALRLEFDRELAGIRARYHEEVEDERRRNAAAARQEASRHGEEVARLQGEWQARLDELIHRRSTEKEEHMRQLSTAVAEAVTQERIRYHSEREAWEQRTVERLRREFEEKERELRAEHARTRDEQLRLVVAQMEGELQNERRKGKAEAEAAAARSRADAAGEAAEWQAAAQEWRRKFEETAAARDATAQAHGSEAARLSQLLGKLDGPLARRSSPL